MQFLVTLFIMYVIYKAFSGKSSASQNLRDAFQEKLKLGTSTLTPQPRLTGASQSSGTYQGRAYSVRYDHSGPEEATLISMVLSSAVHPGLEVDISPGLLAIYGQDRSDWDATSVKLEDYTKLVGPVDPQFRAKMKSPKVKEALASVVGRTGDCSISNRHLELRVGSRVRKAAVLEIYLEWLFDSAQALEAALEESPPNAPGSSKALLSPSPAPKESPSPRPQNISEPPPLVLPPATAPRVSPILESPPLVSNLEASSTSREIILTLPSNTAPLSATPIGAPPPKAAPRPALAPTTPLPPPPPRALSQAPKHQGERSSKSNIEPSPLLSVPKGANISASVEARPLQESLRKTIDSLKDWRLTSKERAQMVEGIGSVSLQVESRELRSSHGLPSRSPYANGKTLVGISDGVEFAIRLRPDDPRAGSFNRGNSLAVVARAVDWDGLYDRLVMEAQP